MPGAPCGDDSATVSRVDAADREPRHAQRVARGAHELEAARRATRASSASRRPRRRRSSPDRRRAPSAVVAERPTRRSAPTSRRASASGASLRPTWTPSAPVRSTRSGRSFSRKSAPCAVARAAERLGGADELVVGERPCRAAARCRPRRAAPRRAARTDPPRAAAPRARDRARAREPRPTIECRPRRRTYRPHRGAVRRGDRGRRHHRPRLRMRARQRGLDVCVLERASRRARRAAAGRPRTGPGDTRLHRRWRAARPSSGPAFAAELGDVGYTRCGSLVARLRRAARARRRVARRSAVPRARAGHRGRLRRRRPACRRRAGRSAPGGGRTRGAARRGGAPGTPTSSSVTPERVELAERDAHRGRPCRARRRRVVGAAARKAARRAAGERTDLRLRGPLPATRIIRSEHVYVVPRATGETVIGATVEDAGFDETPTDKATTSSCGRRCARFPRSRSPAPQSRCEPTPRNAGRRPLIGEWEGLARRVRTFPERDPAQPVTARRSQRSSQAMRRRRSGAVRSAAVRLRPTRPACVG